MQKIKGRLREFEIDTCGQDVQVAVTPEEVGEELQTYRVSVTYPKKTVPGKIRVKWMEPFVDIMSCWCPGGRFDRGLNSDWRPTFAHSRSAAGAPIISLVGKGGNNSCTFAVADAATPLCISAGVSEKLGDVVCVLELFINRIDELEHYETLIRIDSRNCPFYDSIKDVRHWWSECGYTPAPVPEDARRAMFSSWYNFQKDITTDSLLEQCKMAKEVGLDIVIVDDGWQTAENNSGYSFCGDWEVAPSKIPDMKAFVDAVHSIGMKFMLWYSVPFVGVNSKIHSRFEGKYLHSKWNDGNTFILDPRFSDVRAHLVGIYEKAVREWGLDGLKLDFIDAFSLSDDSPKNYEDMDCSSLEAAVQKLLDEITTCLRSMNPDILIEFRQSYIGPVMQKYGNILRVGDCVGGALINRVSSTDLRLLTESTAVHSDMILWNYEAPVETAADQMINVLYCVPQISVLFDKLPEDHKKMLAFYLKFIDENRHVLLDGELVPLGVETAYSQICAKRDGEVIATVFTNPIFKVEERFDKLTIANASGLGDVYIDNTLDEARFAYEIKDCMGETVDSGEVILTNGVTHFDIPVCGFLFLKK